MKNTICLVIRQTDVFVFYTKLVSIPTFQKNFQKIFTKVLANTCSAIYNKTLSQESHNWIHIFTEFWRTVLRRTRLRYAKRKYRRFWNCFELPAIRKHDRQFRLWISKPVTTEWPTEWDMILRQPLFSESKRNNAAEMRAGIEKRHSDRPAENNRPYTTERVSHTIASRETVLTVSAPTGFKSRLLLGNPPNPLKKVKKGLM